MQLPALLIEVDQMTGFSHEFTHAGGAQPRNPDLRRSLYAALVTYACNLGDTRCAGVRPAGEPPR